MWSVSPGEGAYPSGIRGAPPFRSLGCGGDLLTAEIEDTEVEKRRVSAPSEGAAAGWPQPAD